MSGRGNGKDFDVEPRFGGGWELKDLPGGVRVDIGQTILAEGAGGGITMLPWVLDHYERVLRLRPGETWLLRRMCRAAWGWETSVFLSERKLSRESLVTRPTIRAYRRRLEELRYIRRLPGDESDQADHRLRFTVRGLYSALALCIVADPASKWAKEHGGDLGEWARGTGWFDLDFGALAG